VEHDDLDQITELQQALEDAVSLLTPSESPMVDAQLCTLQHLLETLSLKSDRLQVGIEGVHHSVIEVHEKVDKLDAKLDLVLQNLTKGFKDLRSNAVELAESLRRETILGNQQVAELIPDMIAAAKETKDHLSNVFRKHNPDPVTIRERMQEGMSAMTSSIMGAIDRARAEQKIADDEKFDAITNQLRDRFAELSTGLKERLQEQQQGNATAQQVEELKLTNETLKKGIKEVIDKLKDVKADLDELKTHQTALGERMSLVLVKHAELGAVVRALSKNTHGMPSYAMILPVVATGWRSKLNPMRLMRQQYRLYFICAHTKQIAPCGPNGGGYKITAPRQWVLDAAPVLRVGLVLVKVALLASGLPLPVPDLCSGLADKAMHSKYLDAALQLVSRPPEDLTSNAEFVMERLTDLTDHDYSDYKRSGAEELMRETSPKAYETIKEILGNEKINILLTCGLRQVTHRGRIDWVLDNDATEQAWRCAVDEEAAV
jgi:uncharacterized coiled-coil DUF342 family protein